MPLPFPRFGKAYFFISSFFPAFFAGFLSPFFVSAFFAAGLAPALAWASTMPLETANTTATKSDNTSARATLSRTHRNG